MTVYADSSALVKLYADEPGSEIMRALSDELLISDLARVEVPAALWRKHRAGELSLAHTQALVSEFEADLSGLIAIRVGPDTIGLAAGLVERHPLGAYDAVQLATALEAARALEGIDGFACFEDGLREAAAGAGLPLIPSAR